MSDATTVDEYIEALPQERQGPMTRLREVINRSIDPAFGECMQYRMPAWVVPYSVYPDGYHCKPKQPLPFMNIASQKNFIGVYHMGMYASPEVTQWFQDEYAKAVPTKLDMGKSCVRLKKIEAIPYELVGGLAGKMSARDWISIYEGAIKR